MTYFLITIAVSGWVLAIMQSNLLCKMIRQWRKSEEGYGKQRAHDSRKIADHASIVAKYSNRIEELESKIDELKDQQAKVDRWLGEYPVFTGDLHGSAFGAITSNPRTHRPDGPERR